VNSLVAHSCGGTKANHGQEWDAVDEREGATLGLKTAWESSWFVHTITEC